MSLLSLFTDERGFLATDQLVFGAEELTQLQSACELASELSASIAHQADINTAAERAAYSKGFELGQQEAKACAVNEVQRKMLELDQQYQRGVDEQRALCATLAIDIVRKIAGNVAPADWLFAEASMAAAEMVDQTGLVLRVHSSEIEAVKARVQSSQLFERVVADESVERHACSIDTRFGTVDVSLDAQIDQVMKLLSDGVASDD